MPDDQPTFPVVALSNDNQFLHVAADLQSLRMHLVEDLKAWARSDKAPPGAESYLDFYDSRGRRLTPTLGPLWIISSFEVTADIVGEEDLLGRMKEAAQRAEDFERERRRKVLADDDLTPDEVQARVALTPSAPQPPDETVRGYAEVILAFLDETPDGPIPGGVDRGGWLHNAWHAAFG